MKQPFPVAYPHGKSGFRQDYPGGTNARHARKHQSQIHTLHLNWREKPLITAAISYGPSLRNFSLKYVAGPASCRGGFIRCEKFVV
ncbi:MAG: hypothetical protein O6934_02335, partial [SAR324 cluster bacterium]|nr:hypothetical protein [SAR324 cluster bacterium]